METVKLLVFDIDGTLIDRSQSAIQDSTKDAIKRARKNGYEILVATGRSYFLIHDDVIQSLHPDYYVTVNGACLNDKHGDIIHTNGFDEDTIERLIQYCIDNKFPLGVKYAQFIGVYGDYEAFEEGYMGNNHPGNIFLKHDVKQDFYKTTDPLGVFYFAKASTLKDLEDDFKDLKFMPSDREAIEAVRVDIDKTKGIEDVLEKLNLTWDNVITFGDGHNDIDMLEKAHIGVAMGNASKAVQEHADYVTETVLNDGILKALEHYNII